MITTVTANPCLDKTISVEKFDIYEMNRATVLCTDAGGKGINVSRALKRLGTDTRCVGLNFIVGGNIITDTLSNENIEYSFIDVSSELRTCLKVFDKSISHTIEINEYGKEISEEIGVKLLNEIVKSAKDSDFLTLSGSLPKGFKDDFYALCIKKIKKNATLCKVVVDADKNLLNNALKQSPFFIKPNIYEFQSVIGRELKDINDIDTEAQKLIKEYGLGLICVSMSEKGAYITDGTSAFICPLAKVEIKSIQGVGDSMIAGILYGLENGFTLDKVLKLGICTAAEAISLEGTQFCSREGTENLMKQNLNIIKLK